MIGGALAHAGVDRPGTGRDTHSPTAFIRDMGQAYRASGRTKPIMDEFAMHPYMLDSSQPPTLYGFVPQTYCGVRVGKRCSERTGVANVRGDGDPMDVCVLTEKTMAHANFFLRARPIGGLRVMDGDEADDKVVAVLEGDLAYGDLRDIADAPKGLIERLRHYFLTYKQMPGERARTVRIAEVYDRVEAVEVLRRSIDDYRESFGDPQARATLLARLIGERES